MRQTDKKGAIVGTVLAVLVIASILLIIGLAGTPTKKANALSIVNVANFKVEFGRIEGIYPVDENWQVILTYYDNSVEVVGSRIKTVKVEWDANNDSLYIDGQLQNIFEPSIQWGYIIKVWAVNMDMIKSFSEAVAINNRNSDLIREGISYYRTKTNTSVPSRYIAEDIRGDFIFIGNDIEVSDHISIFNGKLTEPDKDYYYTILCTNANEVELPPFSTGDTTNLTLGEVLEDTLPMYWLDSDYDNGYAMGYSAGANYADSRVNTNSASYIAGYNAGTEGQYTFLGLLSAVVDAPVQAIAGIFDIEILGYNMLGFVTGLLTIGLIFFIVRKLGGGL